jgi:hypothetical protein
MKASTKNEELSVTTNPEPLNSEPFPKGTTMNTPNSPTPNQEPRTKNQELSPTKNQELPATKNPP